MKGKKKNKIIFFLLIIFIPIFLLALSFSFIEREKQKAQLEEEEIKRNNEELQALKIEAISSHYGDWVKTTRTTKFYTLEEEEYKEAGSLNRDYFLQTEHIEITASTLYFPILFNEKKYFIFYQDVTPCEPIEANNMRYLNYIPFNQNVITKENARFYQGENLVFTLQESVSLPIWIKEENAYAVVWDNQLFTILKEDSKSLENKENSKAKNATKIPTIAYHFIYDPATSNDCNQVICHTTTQVQSHIDELKKENFFTPTMQEFEWWIDEKIQLPEKSIMITIDDGWYGRVASKIFTENKMNATIFLITSNYNPEEYQTEYVEVHSHGDNLHTPYACPNMGKQGGGILCLPKEQLLEDLKKSREKCFGSTVFAYPFYDFNDYAIEVLKEAGFTMAFMGLDTKYGYYMTSGRNKFLIPRLTLSSTTSVEDLKELLALS